MVDLGVEEREDDEAAIAIIEKEKKEWTLEEVQEDKIRKQRTKARKPSCEEEEDDSQQWRACRGSLYIWYHIETQSFDYEKMNFINSITLQLAIYIQLVKQVTKTETNPN